MKKKYWERNDLEKRRGPDHKVIVAYTKPIINIIKNRIGLKKKILEIGCGNGFFTKPLSEFYEIKGVDLSKKMISLNPVKNCEVQDAQNLREINNSFDVAFSANLLHHLKNPKKALEEMKRVSKQYIIIIEPNKKNPMMFFFLLCNKEERGALKQSIPYFKEIFKKLHLKITYKKTFGSIAPNKTPEFLLPILKLFFNIPIFGLYHLIILEK